MIQVHRLVLVDSKDVVQGIVSLSDLLQALVLNPAGIHAFHSCLPGHIQHLFSYKQVWSHSTPVQLQTGLANLL